MKTETVNMTPAMARIVLLGNKGNRPIRANVVEYLVREIINGNWKLTHQGIAISSFGNVLDGQHRLHAIVKSGVTVKILVNSYVNENTFMFIDGGVTRTVSDKLRIPSKTTEVYTAAERILRGNIKPSPTRIEYLMCSQLAQGVDAVLEKVKKRTKLYSSGAFKLAAAVLYVHGDFGVAGRLSNLVNADITELTPHEAAFFKAYYNKGNAVLERVNARPDVARYAVAHSILSNKRSDNKIFKAPTDAYITSAKLDLETLTNKKREIK